MNTKTINLLASFTAYVKENPDQRFWQALRNWSGHNAIYALTKGSPIDFNQAQWPRGIDVEAHDTFND